MERTLSVSLAAGDAPTPVRGSSTPPWSGLRARDLAAEVRERGDEVAHERVGGVPVRKPVGTDPLGVARLAVHLRGDHDPRPVRARVHARDLGAVARDPPAGRRVVDKWSRSLHSLTIGADATGTTPGWVIRRSSDGADAGELFDRGEAGGDLGDAVVPERAHALGQRGALDLLARRLRGGELLELARSSPAAGRCRSRPR